MCNTSNLFEKLHIKLCRCILGVNNKTSNVGIYGELGRYPMYIDIVQQCRRYSIHLENNKENGLLQKIYQAFKKFNTPKPDLQTYIISIKPYQNFVICLIFLM